MCLSVFPLLGGELPGTASAAGAVPGVPCCSQLGASAAAAGGEGGAEPGGRHPPLLGGAQGCAGGPGLLQHHHLAHCLQVHNPVIHCWCFVVYMYF